MKTQCTIKALGESFLLAQRAENKSQRTIETYGAAINIFEDWLSQNGLPTAAAEVKREHVSGFISSLLSKGNKPATASNRYRALKTFFRWAVDEGEIENSPMGTLKPPRIPDEPPAVISQEAFHRLLKACEGNGFEERRDAAIILLLFDSGLRRAEIAGLRMQDVDPMRGSAIVTGKGNRVRECPFGHKTAQALDRYKRSRSGHPHAKSDAYWLGERGPLTHWGIDQLVRARAAQAKIGPVHLHQFRHSWAHFCQLNGMSESALMSNAGWQSRQMVDRYAKSAAAERAREAHRAHGPVDRL